MEIIIDYLLMNWRKIQKLSDFTKFNGKKVKKSNFIIEASKSELL